MQETEADGFVNVNIKMCQEPARETIATLNCSGTFHEPEQPSSEHSCVSAEPLTKPTEPQPYDMLKGLLPTMCIARFTPYE